MKCSEASRLLDEYLFNRLDCDKVRLLEEHIGSCIRCRHDMLFRKSLASDCNDIWNFKAPAGTEDSVLNAVYRLEADRKSIGKNIPRKDAGLIYRRLGYSLVLSAGIILFSLFMPVAGVRLFSFSGSAQHGFGAQNTPKITDTFTGVDSEFRGLFKSINDSLLKFKGVAKNEL